MNPAIGLLTLALAYFAVAMIGRSVDELEATAHPPPVYDWRIESRADDLPHLEQYESIRYALLAPEGECR